MANKAPVPRFYKSLGFVTTSARSELMKKIRSNDTKMEILLRKSLWALGVRYRKNYKKLPGAPDILLTKAKVAIFVDGEFWHGYNWVVKKNRLKTNQNFWIPKIERNIERDIENNEALKKAGFKVIRFWEHEIKKDLNNCVKKILGEIHY